MVQDTWIWNKHVETQNLHLSHFLKSLNWLLDMNFSIFQPNQKIWEPNNLRRVITTPKCIQIQT